MRLKKKEGFFKRFLKFLLSTVGLCCMVSLYCVAGAFIFEHLEKRNEVLVCHESSKEYYPFENKTLTNMLNVIKAEPTDILGMTIQLRSILQAFRYNTIVIGYDGKNCSALGTADGHPYKWTWSGSLMFSVTVISTIGKFAMIISHFRFASKTFR